MRSREDKIRFVFLFFDLIILNIAILFLAWARYDVELKNYHQISIYLLLGNMALILTFFIFVRNNLYLRDNYKNRVMHITRRSLIFVIFLSMLGFLFLPKQYSRSYLLEYAGLYYIGKLAFYWLLYSFLKYRRKKGLNTSRVLIVGESETTCLLRQIIKTNRILGYNFIGFASDNSKNPECLGTPDQLVQLIKKHQIQMLFVSLSLFSHQIESREYLNICSTMGIRLRFIPENQRWLRTRANMESIGGLVMIDPQAIPLDEWSLRIWKRLSDLLISSFAILFIFTWLFPIIAIIIKISSKGPVFFVQKRTGINKKTFYCIKFRSMKVNNRANCQQAHANDARISPIGQFLRKTNLDELPQFFNVFLGQMSIVGPRPHMLRHTGTYTKLIDQYLVRHYVKPGVTGWAQINGYRGETDELWKMQKRVEYDMEYIENWNFWWDISIVWKTVFAMDAYKNAG